MTHTEITLMSVRLTRMMLALTTTLVVLNAVR